MSHNFPSELFTDIDFDFTPDKAEKLCTYNALLHKWQKAINLVSRHTLSDSWLRHFVDSAQLAPLIRSYMNAASIKSPRLYDIGSGAGFPALVLAMLCDEIDVHVIESDSKKCSFLRTVSRETSTPLTIHNDRIEQVIFDGADEDLLRCDIVSARALASLEDLLRYVKPISNINPDLRLFLPKGQKSQEEIDSALNSYQFDYIRHESCVDTESCILELYNLQL